MIQQTPRPWVNQADALVVPPPAPDLIVAIIEIGARDSWEVNVAAGDCEDFVLTKRRKLISLGWSPRTLRIAVARTASGEGHAVVALRGAVLDGRLAVLPAGAGIVAGSEGEAELAETRVKQGSVLDAFRGAD